MALVFVKFCDCICRESQWKKLHNCIVKFNLCNRFANFANDGSRTTSHLTVVNKNIVLFEVDLGEPYSINNFKLYSSKKVFAIKKIYTKQGLHYDRLLLRLKKN